MGRKLVAQIVELVRRFKEHDEPSLGMTLSEWLEENLTVVDLADDPYVRQAVVKLMVADASALDAPAPSELLKQLHAGTLAFPEMRSAWLKAAATDPEVVDRVLKGAVACGLYIRRSEVVKDAVLVRQVLESRQEPRG